MRDTLVGVGSEGTAFGRACFLRTSDWGERLFVFFCNWGLFMGGAVAVTSRFKFGSSEARVLSPVMGEGTVWREVFSRVGWVET